MQRDQKIHARNVCKKQTNIKKLAFAGSARFRLVFGSVTLRIKLCCGTVFEVGNSMHL